MFALFLSIGTLIIGFALFVRRKGLAAADWPSVPGEITESKIDRDPHDGDSSVSIRYRYRVNGEMFESTQISFKVRPHSPVANQTLIARFPHGTTTPVYFNPGDPKEAVIDNQPNQSWLLIAGIGVAGIIIAFVERH